MCARAERETIVCIHIKVHKQADQLGMAGKHATQHTYRIRSVHPFEKASTGERKFLLLGCVRFYKPTDLGLDALRLNRSDRRKETSKDVAAE